MKRFAFAPFALFGRTAIGRIYLFRNEAVTLWHALRHPETPLHLKAAMLVVAFYLLNPIDLVTDFLPGLGLVDDFILVPLAVSWIVKRLPVAVTAATAGAKARRAR